MNRNLDSLLAMIMRRNNHYDIIALSETWLKENESLNKPNYQFLSLSRKHGAVHIINIDIQKDRMTHSNKGRTI